MRLEIQKFINYLRHQGLFLWIIFGALFIAAIVDFVFGISTFQVVFEYARKLYSQWGLAFMFFASVIEGILFINWYFPGSAIVLIGALLSRGGIVPFWKFVPVVFFGFFLAFSVDYFIGRYGFYHLIKKFKFFTDRIETAKLALKKRSIATFFIWYFHPQSGNFVATAAGILHFPFLKFLILNAVAGFLWMAFWVGLVYIFGGIVLQIIDNYSYLIAILALAIWVVAGYMRERKTIVASIP